MLSSDEECDSYEGLKTFSLPKKKIDEAIEDSTNANVLLFEIMTDPNKYKSYQLLEYALKHLDNDAVVPILRFICYEERLFFRFCFARCKDFVLLGALVVIMKKHNFTICHDDIRLSLCDSLTDLERFVFLFEMFPFECKTYVKKLVQAQLWRVSPEVLQYVFDEKYLDPKNEIEVNHNCYSLFKFAMNQGAPVETLVLLHKCNAVYDSSFPGLIIDLSEHRDINNAKRAEILTAFIPLYMHKCVERPNVQDKYYLYEWVRNAFKPFQDEVIDNIEHASIRFGVVLTKALDVGIYLPVIIDSGCWMEEHEYDFYEATKDSDVNYHLSCATLKFCLTEQEIIDGIKISSLF